MIPAPHPTRGPVRLLRLSAAGRLSHRDRADLPQLLRRGDLVVANDAATLPASLSGRFAATGAPVELRLAAWVSPGDPTRFVAVLFGAGDHRVRTEDRPPPPRVRPGDMLALGPLLAIVEDVLDHPRLLAVRLCGTPAEVWAGIARHGRPIQYAHVPEPLELWDIWTKVASRPLAFEAPSAGFALNWRMLAAFREREIGFATLTLAAGISSTGDPALDRKLPLDEAFHIPEETAAAIAAAIASGSRIVAIGTTVVRGLEAAAVGSNAVHAGDGVATGRIGPDTRLKIVDAIVTGVHAPGESHYDLLRAFAGEAPLSAMAAAETRGYRNHEFGDLCLIERQINASKPKQSSPCHESRAGRCEPETAIAL